MQRGVRKTMIAYAPTLRKQEIEVLGPHVKVVVERTALDVPLFSQLACHCRYIAWDTVFLVDGEGVGRLQCGEVPRRLVRARVRYPSKPVI